MGRKLVYKDLGLIDYKECWDLQKETLQKRIEGEIFDTFYLLEHPHTYTIGKNAGRDNLIASDEFIKKHCIAIYDIERGGDITYHGPGQIVGYPIINLTERGRSARNYVTSLEEVIIRVCDEYGLKAERNPINAGVWIGDNKICAIGVKFSRWVTMHGFAFNINTDLSLFNGIVPCGIKDKGVTSLQKELGKELDISDLKQKILHHFADVFEYETVNECDFSVSGQ